jgi:release factor glutamine methyltransferase
MPWSPTNGPSSCRVGDLPAHEARWIIEAVDGATSDLAQAAVQRMVDRRLAGEPIQYVLGSWGFRTLDLFVDRRVLIPRPETEVVAGYALAEVARRHDHDPVRVADLGTGSGAIGLAVAVEAPWTEVWLTDASPDALAVARANLAGVGRAGARVTVSEGPWFDALPNDGRFDVIVSNPPYVAAHEELPPEVADWEPASALVAGPTGREALEHLVAEAPARLASGGSLVLELAPHQAGTVRAAALSTGYVDVAVHPDLAGLDRVLVARRP